jgi:DNA-binding HxlR family transcriptional regulator
MIIQNLLNGPMRFHELQRTGMGVDAKTLSRVLKYLVNEEIVRREVLTTQPIAVRYSLTEKGRDLKPVIDSLDAWGLRWLRPASAMPVPSGP